VIEAGFVAVKDVEPVGFVGQGAIGESSAGGSGFAGMAASLFADFVETAAFSRTQTRMVRQRETAIFWTRMYSVEVWLQFGDGVRRSDRGIRRRGECTRKAGRGWFDCPRKLALPSGLMGPCDLAPLIRLAMIRRSEVIFYACIIGMGGRGWLVKSFLAA
jgi:hypothetical protein